MATYHKEFIISLALRAVTEDKVEPINEFIITFFVLGRDKEGYTIVGEKEKDDG